MGKYDFTSPGAAAGSGIMEVMTQRRAEARQRMLDEIAAKDSESERNLRDIQGQTAKTQSEIAQFEEARKNWHAGQQVTGPMADIAAKYNALGKDPNQPTPQVSTEESFSVPDDPSAQVEQPVGPNQPVTLPKADTGSNFYQGSQEDQTRERRRANMDRVKQAIAAHPDMSEMEKMLTVSQALEDPNLPGEFWKTLEDPQAVNSFDPVSNKVTPLMGKDGKPITTRGNQTIIDRGRPPVGPQPQFVGTDSKGKIVWGQQGSAYTWDENGKKVPYNGEIEAKPTNASKSAGETIPPALLNRATTARAAFEKTRTRLIRPNGDAGARSAFTEAATSAVGALKDLPPNVYSVFAQIINDPSADTTPTTDIVSGDIGLNEEERALLQKLLIQIRGK